jgi:hypothetical protein
MLEPKIEPPSKIDELLKKVCEKKKSSPLCNKELFYRLYAITEERIP